MGFLRGWVREVLRALMVHFVGCGDYNADMSHDMILAEALRLSAADRIRLVQETWDSIAEIPEAVDLSDEHRALLRQRLEAHRRDPSAASPWEEVRSCCEQQDPKTRRGRPAR